MKLCLTLKCNIQHVPLLVTLTLFIFMCDSRFLNKGFRYAKSKSQRWVDLLNKINKHGKQLISTISNFSIIEKKF